MSRSIWTCGIALVLGTLSAPLRAQANPQQPAPVAAPTPSQSSAPASHEQAYSLPADKLEKAVRLCRIRNILDISGGIWGLVFMWLLLAMRGRARVDSWTQRVARPRWVQGLIFFSVGIVLATLASLPLDVVGHHYSSAYGISVESWASWSLDLAKSLGLSLVIGVPLALFFNWIVRRWPRRYWLGLWVATLPLLVLGIFVAPLLEPIFNKFEPLAKSNLRAGHGAGKSSGPHGDQHSARAHVSNEGQPQD